MSEKIPKKVLQSVQIIARFNILHDLLSAALFLEPSNSYQERIKAIGSPPEIIAAWNAGTRRFRMHEQAVGIMEAMKSILQDQPDKAFHEWLVEQEKKKTRSPAKKPK